jgi:hypothetical protein
MRVAVRLRPGCSGTGWHILVPEQSDASHHRVTWLRRALVVIALSLLALLVAQVVRRVRFPWDAYIWSESPFLTNMWKLSVGQPFYQSRESANSFVYAPGLELVCSALLRPLGLALDVRACRVVVVLLGALASLAASRSVSRFAGALSDERCGRRLLSVFAGAVACLVLFKSFTADVCHPDNLHVLHATATLAALGFALETKRLAHALVVVFVAALGVLTKQTAAAGVIGALVALLVLEPSFRTRRAALALLAVGLGALGAVLWLLFRSEHARFWLIEVPGHHAYVLSKLDALTSDVLLTPHRALLWALAPYAVISLYLSSSSTVRKLLFAWLAVGVTEVAPAFLAYFKWMGLSNNLAIVDVWTLIVVVPVLFSVARAPALRLGACALLLLGLIPYRAAPGPGHYAYFRQVDDVVREAHSRGETVLVDHGTAPLLHAGIEQVPVDRMNSMLELVEADLPLPAAAFARVGHANYDRILFHNLSWYGALGPAITENYRVERIIKAPLEQGAGRDYARYDLRTGYQEDLNAAAIRVMVPKRPRQAPGS